MHRDRALHALAFLMLSAFSASCGGGDGGTGPAGQAALSLHTNPQPTDTIGATLPDGVQADVLDSDGKPLVGVAVTFTSLGRFDVAGEATGVVAVTDFGQPPDRAWQSTASDNSDRYGHVASWLMLGSRAGDLRLEVRAPSLGIVDTVTIVVHPGAAVGVAMLLGDTAAYVGRQVQLRGAVVDRFLNPRPERVTYGAITPNVEVDQEGMLTALAIGRGAVVAKGFQQAADTAWVSVVPQARFAAYRFAGDTVGLVSIDLDGSGLRLLVPTYGFSLDAGCAYCAIGATLSWAPGGALLVHTGMGVPGDGQAPRLRLYTYTPGAAASRQLVPSEPDVHDSGPRFSRDGQWVYFAEQHYPYYAPTLFRVRSDGTGLAHIGPAKRLDRVAWQPSPSPDGDRLAFVVDSPVTSVRILDIAADTLSTWSTPGTYPQWSPGADVIALVEERGGALKLVNADGTGLRTLSEPGRLYLEGAFDWSPDGQWILARSAAGVLELVNVGSGLTLPLPYTGSLYNPAWQTQ
jgi:hypothetical protein